MDILRDILALDAADPLRPAHLDLSLSSSSPNTNTLNPFTSSADAASNVTPECLIVPPKPPPYVYATLLMDVELSLHELLALDPRPACLRAQLLGLDDKPVSPPVDILLPQPASSTAGAVYDEPSSVHVSRLLFAGVRCDLMPSRLPVLALTLGPSSIVLSHAARWDVADGLLHPLSEHISTHQHQIPSTSTSLNHSHSIPLHALASHRHPGCPCTVRAALSYRAPDALLPTLGRAFWKPCSTVRLVPCVHWPVSYGLHTRTPDPAIQTHPPGGNASGAGSVLVGLELRGLEPLLGARPRHVAVTVNHVHVPLPPLLTSAALAHLPPVVWICVPHPSSGASSSQSSTTTSNTTNTTTKQQPLMLTLMLHRTPQNARRRKPTKREPSLRRLVAVKDAAEIVAQFEIEAGSSSEDDVEEVPHNDTSVLESHSAPLMFHDACDPVQSLVLGRVSLAVHVLPPRKPHPRWDALLQSSPKDALATLIRDPRFFEEEPQEKSEGEGEGEGEGERMGRVSRMGRMVAHFAAAVEASTVYRARHPGLWPVLVRHGVQLAALCIYSPEALYETRLRHHAAAVLASVGMTLAQFGESVTASLGPLMGGDGDVQADQEHEAGVYALLWQYVVRGDARVVWASRPVTRLLEVLAEDVSARTLVRLSVLQRAILRVLLHALQQAFSPADSRFGNLRLFLVRNALPSVSHALHRLPPTAAASAAFGLSLALLALLHHGCLPLSQSQSESQSEEDDDGLLLPDAVMDALAHVPYRSLYATRSLYPTSISLDALLVNFCQSAPRAAALGCVVHASASDRPLLMARITPELNAPPHTSMQEQIEGKEGKEDALPVEMLLQASLALAHHSPSTPWDALWGGHDRSTLWLAAVRLHLRDPHAFAAVAHDHPLWGACARARYGARGRLSLAHQCVLRGRLEEATAVLARAERLGCDLGRLASHVLHTLGRAPFLRLCAMLLMGRDGSALEAGDSAGWMAFDWRDWAVALGRPVAPQNEGSCLYALVRGANVDSVVVRVPLSLMGLDAIDAWVRREYPHASPSSSSSGVSWTLLMPYDGPSKPINGLPSPHTTFTTLQLAPQNAYLPLATRSLTRLMVTVAGSFSSIVPQNAEFALPVFSITPQTVSFTSGALWWLVDVVLAHLNPSTSSSSSSSLHRQPIPKDSDAEVDAELWRRTLLDARVDALWGVEKVAAVLRDEEDARQARVRGARQEARRVYMQQKRVAEAQGKAVPDAPDLERIGEVRGEDEKKLQKAVDDVTARMRVLEDGLTEHVIQMLA